MQDERTVGGDNPADASQGWLDPATGQNTSPPTSEGERQPEDPLQGYGTYRLVQYLCLSLLLIPLSFLLMFAAPRLEIFGAMWLLSLAFAPMLAFVGVLIGITAGVRGSLSTSLNQKMWFLVLGVILAFFLLFKLMSGPW